MLPIDIVSYLCFQRPNYTCDCVWCVTFQSVTYVALHLHRDLAVAKLVWNRSLVDSYLLDMLLHRDWNGVQCGTGPVNQSVYSDLRKAWLQSVSYNLIQKHDWRNREHVTIVHHLCCINHHNEELSVMNEYDFLNRAHLKFGHQWWLIMVDQKSEMVIKVIWRSKGRTKVIRVD